MSLFFPCQGFDCNLDAKLRCSCSKYLCYNHFEHHSLGNPSNHQSSLILFPLDEQEMECISSFNLSSIIKDQIKQEMSRRKQRIEEMLNMMRQIEAECQSRVEEILNSSDKLKLIFSEIATKQAISLASENPLVAQLGQLKQEGSLCQSDIEELVRKHLSRALPSLELFKQFSSNEAREKSTIEQIDYTGEQSKPKYPKIEFFNPPKYFEIFSSRCKVIAVSPDHQLIATDSFNGSDYFIKLWNYRNRTIVSDFKGHERAITALDFSSSNSLLVSGSRDCTAKVWSLETLQCLLIYREHSHSVNSVSISPNSEIVASGSSDCTIHIWNPKQEVSIYRLAEHSEKVSQVKFTGDGKRLISASSDKTIKIWDLNTGTAIRRFQNSDKIRSLSLYNQFLASGGLDKVIRLSDIEKGEYTGILEGHSSCIESVDFSSCGSFIVSASSEGITVWKHGIPIKNIKEEGCMNALFVQKGIVSIAKRRTKQFGKRSYSYSLKLWSFD